MNDFKPNSHRFKEEQKAAKQERKKLEKVVRGTPKIKKKSEISKFASAFVPENKTNIRDYIVWDVIFPTIKDTVWEIVSNGIHMVLYGETSRGKKSSLPGSRVNYNSISSGSTRRENDRFSNNNKLKGYNYDDVYVETRGEAEEVLSQLDSMIETYGYATVADLYDAIGVTGEYTDCKYGWTNLSTASAIRTRDGYKFKLPKALPID